MLRIVATIVVVLLAAATVAAEDLDGRFIEGLRQRRMYGLAEAYCLDRQSRIPQRDAAQANLTIELVRTLSLSAANSPPEAREAVWNKAHAAAANFLRTAPPHPRGPLVAFQAALTYLAQGELARQEIEAGMPEAERSEAARAALRQAASRLEALDKELKAQIPLRHRSPPAAGEMTAEELERLREHVQHQLARTERNRGLLFPAKSDDRVGLLLAATQLLEQLLPQVTENAALQTAVQLDLAENQRLLGRFDVAQELALKLASGNVDPETQHKARAELLRIALARTDFAQAIELLRSTQTDGIASGELSFARFEAYLALARAARERRSSDNLSTQEAARFEQSAAKAAEDLEANFGPAWGRRASQLLISSLPRSGLTSVPLLSRAADNLFLRGDFDQALASYDQAAAQAQSKQDATAAFELAYKAALVEQKRGRHLPAAVRLRVLAKSQPAAVQSAAAHLLAAWNVAQAAATDSSAQPLHEEILREHLALWPQAESADQARLWLGQLQERRLELSAAAATYSQISRGSAHYAAAIAAAARCWKQELATLAQAGKPPVEQATAAITFFRRVVAGPENRWPERWTQADRTAALAAAELTAAYLPGSASDAEDLLRRALAGSFDAAQEWQTAARSELVVVLAAQSGRQQDALGELKAIGAASTDQMLAVLAGLSQIAERASPRVRSQVAAVQLEAVSVVKSSGGQLTADQQVSLDRMQLEALASLGRREESLAGYRALAKQHADDGAIQEGLARLLMTSNDPAHLQQALQQWRIVASRSKPRSSRWLAAKYSVAQAQFKLGDRTAAIELLRFMLETPPGLQGTEWEAPYRQLLADCEK